MKRRINKPCPFCYESYQFRTANGLIRHVQKNHMYNKFGKWVFPPFEKAEELRIETANGVKYVPVDGWEEVEEFLQDYIIGFNNPSKRSSRLWQYVRT